MLFEGFAADAPVMAMDLDAAKTVLLHGDLHHLEHAGPVALRVDERKTIAPVAPPGHDSRHLAVGDDIVGMECREEDRPVDSSDGGPAKILPQRCCRIPGAGQPIAFTRMAVTIDNHVNPVGKATT